jgi:hypothetical protein
LSQHPVTRPELIILDDSARQRVHEQIAAKNRHCESCGAADFRVGDALYLGYLFLDEDKDAYMVALTCCNPDCPRPRTGIVLPERAIFIDADDSGGLGAAV